MSYLSILNKNKPKIRLFFDELNEDILGLIFYYIDVNNFKSVLSFHQFNVLLNKPIYWINRLKIEYPGITISILNKKFSSYSLINSDIYQILKKDINNIKNIVYTTISRDMKEQINKHLIKNNRSVLQYYDCYELNLNQETRSYSINTNSYYSNIRIHIINLTFNELIDILLL